MSAHQSQRQTIGNAALTVLDELALAALGFADMALLDQVATRSGLPPEPISRKRVLDALGRDPRFRQRLARVWVGDRERQVRVFSRADQPDPARDTPPLPDITLPADAWRRRQFVAALFDGDPLAVTPAQLDQVAAHLATALAQPTATQRRRIIACYGLAGAPRNYEELAAQDGRGVVTIRNSVRLGLVRMGRFIRAQPAAESGAPAPERALPGDALFWERVDRSGPCWRWTGTMDNHYPVFKRGGRKQMATRYVYEVCVGPIPAGHRVIRTCGEEQCVRPEHLAAATPRAILGASSPPAEALQKPLS